MQYPLFRERFLSSGCVSTAEIAESFGRFDKNNLTRWCGQGLLVQLRNGFYAFPEMLRKGEKIAVLTAYDYSLATLLDMAKIDVILVGDSAANVMAGYKTTLPITLDAMIYHASSVVRGKERKWQQLAESVSTE